MWNADLTTIESIEKIKQRSFQQPCLIFKHSTTCSISLMAKSRIEAGWDFEPDALEAYYLDLKVYREVSNYIADTFEVHHESPQALIIRNGQCIYDCSHLDITIAELHEGLAPSNF
jgi:bacillithiol system protein YtxJ